MSIERVPVTLDGGRSYDVTIGPGTLGEVGKACRDACPKARRVFLVVDDALPPAWVERTIKSIGEAGLEPVIAQATATERAKSMATVTGLLEAICTAGLDRSEPVVGLGGGIVTDIAGYVAASYRRGVPLLQCPTTLLSMVDASVGGKTGVNLEAGGELLKNMAGAFYQPFAVIADTDTLTTLDQRTLRSGFAECIKHAMIASNAGEPDLLTTTESLASGIARGTAPDAAFIARNVRIKAAIVATDEREMSESGGGRALLNLGHTFAHAIETIPGLTPTGDPSDAPLQHGEAVALGLIAATHVSHRLGLCDENIESRTLELVAAAGLPGSVAGLPEPGVLLDRVRSDKKTIGGDIRLVLPTEHGRAEVRPCGDEAAIVSGFEAIASPTDGRG